MRMTSTLQKICKGTFETKLLFTVLSSTALLIWNDQNSSLNVNSLNLIWGSTLSSLCACVEHWRERIWGSSISPLLFLQRIPCWFTQRLASRGSGVGLTTSCTVKAPFQSTARQYVCIFTLYSVFSVSITSPVTVRYHKFLKHFNMAKLLPSSSYKKCLKTQVVPR